MYRRAARCRELSGPQSGGPCCGMRGEVGGVPWQGGVRENPGGSWERSVERWSHGGSEWQSACVRWDPRTRAPSACWVCTQAPDSGEGPGCGWQRNPETQDGQPRRTPQRFHRGRQERGWAGAGQSWSVTAALGPDPAALWGPLRRVAPGSGFFADPQGRQGLETEA